MGDAEDIVFYIPRLRRYARSLTGDRTLAEDLVQDTLERAWGRLHLWRRGTNLRAWLFTIMHNLHVNQARSSFGKYRETAEDETLELPVRPMQEEQLELKDLKETLERLPEGQREVLLLVGLEQMSYEEVAKVLSIPLGTVMSRLSRGRERLRALMEGRVHTPQLKVVK